MEFKNIIYIQSFASKQQIHSSATSINRQKIICNVAIGKLFLQLLSTRLTTCLPCDSNHDSSIIIKKKIQPCSAKINYQL